MAMNPSADPVQLESLGESTIPQLITAEQSRLPVVPDSWKDMLSMALGSIGLFIKLWRSKGRAFIKYAKNKLSALIDWL